MTTYRTLRIAPDLPNQEGIDDDDTPPASPYQNRIPPRARPAIRLGSVTITLPRLTTVIYVLLTFASIAWIFLPRQYKPRLITPTHEPSLRYKNVDWRKYAYTMMATDTEHVCASLMVFDQLEQLGSKADRVLFYPEDWEHNHDHMPEHVDNLLKWAKILYNIKTKPVKVHGIRMLYSEDQKTGNHRFDIPEKDAGQMDPSITKFLSLAETSYLRTIHLESHISLLKHLDELFLAPPSRMALTRRYLTNPTTKQLSAHMFMVFPHEEEAESLMDLASKSIWTSDYYDSQVLTEQYSDQAMLLPHRLYGVNSAEFRRQDHYDFLGSEWEEWNPERVMREASIVLFDEAPIPKPWISWPSGMPQDLLPACDFGPGSDEDIGCRNRKIWLDLYNDHRRRRKDVCRMLTLQGGEWQKKKKPEEEKPKEEEKNQE